MIDPTLILEFSFLILLSAFFSSSETALFTLGRAQQSQLKRTNPILGFKVLSLLANPTRLLAMILFCNMLINVLIFSISYKLTSFWAEDYGVWGTFVSFVLPVFVVLTFGEVLPKSLALCFPYQWSLAVAYPISWVMKFLAPVLKLLEWFMFRSSESQTLKHSELEDFVDETAKEAGLERLEGGLLKDLIRFGVLHVDEVMVPRSDLVAFQLSKGKQALRELFKAKLLTKIPVYRRSLDDVSGVIYLRDFIAHQGDDLESLIKPLPFYPQQMRVNVLYQYMRLRRQKTALIVDEYGGTAGIITFKDILEEIVGEFNEDLVEPESEIKWIDKTSCEVSATLPIREFEELVDHEFKEGNYLTVGGYLLESLGRIPKKGEQINLEGYEFQVIEVERSKLVKILVKGISQVETA